MKTRITYEECTKVYKIDTDFLESLEDLGLLPIEKENDIKYIMYEDLSVLERFADWHYNLEINIAGIEIIHHLLEKMKKMEQERKFLYQRLKFGNLDEKA